MNVETVTQAEAVPAAATNASTSRLGPPFFSPWQVYGGPKPRGFFCNHRLDSYRGTMWAEMGAEPHPPNAPLTIGWCWFGWKRNLYLPYAGTFTVFVRPDRIAVNHNGGNWVPKCSISLRQGSNLVDEDVQNLIAGRTCVARVRAPRGGLYELSVGGSIRAVYRGSASPYGAFDATVLAVLYSGYLSTEPSAASAGDEAGDQVPILLEDNDATHEELKEQLASLADTAEVRDIGSIQDLLSQQS
ncbi:MAG: hypothetical protein D6696_07230 [Acidobacteria bacterium]|nr:MAG: hypothetical protein D6696_07230 [Acidobacteriota bacterium]